MSLPQPDTSTEAHALQLAVYRRMTPKQRLSLGLRMTDEGREIARAGVRARHPEYSAEEVEDAVRLMYLGPDLFRAAWPGRKVAAL